MLLIDFDARFGSVPGLEAECITYPRPVSQAVGSEQLLILRCRLDPQRECPSVRFPRIPRSRFSLTSKSRERPSPSLLFRVYPWVQSHHGQEAGLCQPYAKLVLRTGPDEIEDTQCHRYRNRRPGCSTRRSR